PFKTEHVSDINAHLDPAQIFLIQIRVKGSHSNLAEELGVHASQIHMQVQRMIAPARKPSSETVVACARQSRYPVHEANPAHTSEDIDEPTEERGMHCTVP